jgi:hypothetical protein
MPGSNSTLRCVTSCTLREFCQSPASCSPWMNETLGSFKRHCHSTRAEALAFAGAIALFLIVSTTLFALTR